MEPVARLDAEVPRSWDGLPGKLLGVVPNGRARAKHAPFMVARRGQATHQYVMGTAPEDVALIISTDWMQHRFLNSIYTTIENQFSA